MKFCQWAFFLETYSTNDVSASLLWETGKAFLRGSIISYASAKKCAALERQLNLQSKLEELDRKFKITPSKMLHRELIATRSALDQLLTQESRICFILCKTKTLRIGK